MPWNSHPIISFHLQIANVAACLDLGDSCCYL
ncbi:hypothetical protein GLYMA_14G029300v4 [Glycine max]|nr:hypothetical protein GLYMA_14G029300v4 [Glycine max]KAH1092865.1 hypothetical protein GYH30_038865 [Glycine max]